MMNEGVHGVGGIVWMLIVAVLVVVPFWKICTKAGFPGALSLLVLVPLVNLGFLYILAFTPWRVGQRDDPAP